MLAWSLHGMVSLVSRIRIKGRIYPISCSCFTGYWMLGLMGDGAGGVADLEGGWIATLGWYDTGRDAYRCKRRCIFYILKIQRHFK
jgi:hypothetical protein